jgi:hypothetical protein
MTTDQFRELERRYVRRHDGHWALRKAFTTHVLPAPQSYVVLPSPSPTRLALPRSRVARLRQHVGPLTMGRLCTCSRPGEQHRREPRSRTCHDVPVTAGGVTHTQRERERGSELERERQAHAAACRRTHRRHTHIHTYTVQAHTHTNTHVCHRHIDMHIHTPHTHVGTGARAHTDAYMHVHHSHTHTTRHHIHMHTHTPHTHVDTPNSGARTHRYTLTHSGTLRHTLRHTHIHIQTHAHSSTLRHTHTHTPMPPPHTTHTRRYATAAHTHKQ